MICPICRKPVDMKNPDRPFCSERCRLLDLGNWVDGNYVISTPAPISANQGRDNELDED